MPARVVVPIGVLLLALAVVSSSDAKRAKPCGDAACVRVTAGGLTVRVTSRYAPDAGSPVVLRWRGASQEWTAPGRREGMVVDRAWLARTGRGYELALAGTLAIGGSGTFADVALLRLEGDRWRTLWELAAHPRLGDLPGWLPAMPGDTSVVTTGQAARVLRLVSFAVADTERTGLQEAHAGPHVRFSRLLIRTRDGYRSVPAGVADTRYAQVFYAMSDLRLGGTRANASAATLAAMRTAGLAGGTWVPAPAAGGFLLCGGQDLRPAYLLPVVATEGGWALEAPRPRTRCR